MLFRSHFFQALHAGAACFFLVRNKASLHAAANDAYLYLAAPQRLLQLVGGGRQILAMRLKGFEAVGLQEIELFGNGLSGRDAILARQAQPRLLRWFGQSQRSDRGWGGADDSSQRGQGQKLAAIQVHKLAVHYVAAQKAKIGEFVPLCSG